MRLVSFLRGSKEALGVVVGDRAVATADLGPSLPRTMAELLAGGRKALDQLTAHVGKVHEQVGRDTPLVSQLKLLPPVTQPSKIIAVGRNYRDHATEEGVNVPPAPLLFAKFPSSLIGDGDTICWDDRVTSQVDYEAELCVVIGTLASNVEAADALRYVLGYTCLNDVSARDIQFADGQWIRGKSFDTFCPTGPALVTKDEIPDPQTLALRCYVNGELVQDANTREMFFGVSELIAYCSRFMRLQPGDLIATGTPGGVGVFRDPPKFLRHGDAVTVEIEGIGTLKNTCRVLHPRPRTRTSTAV